MLTLIFIDSTPLHIQLFKAILHQINVALPYRKSETVTCHLNFTFFFSFWEAKHWASWENTFLFKRYIYSFKWSGSHWVNYFFHMAQKCYAVSWSCIWPFMRGRQWTRGYVILESPQKWLNVFQMNIL